MTTRLKEYQKEGVKKIHQFNGRVLLADSMGLGKTLQCLKYITEVKHSPVLIVCPASLKLHWQKEAWNHCGLDSMILSSTSPGGYKEIKKQRILIINYDILDAWLPYLKMLKPKMVVGDEIHAIKNLAAKRTKGFRVLAKRAESVIGISGTPLTNRPWELFPILNILCPEEFPSSFAFGQEYCEATHYFGRWQFRGARNLKALHRKLRKLCMIRRTMEEVLTEMPPIQRQVFPIAMENRKEYDEAESDLIAWLAKTDIGAARRAQTAERYARFTYLKRLAVKLKWKGVIEWIETFLESTDEKIILGLHHREVISQLEKKYKKICVVIHGDKTMKQRQEAELEFRQVSKCRILLGQMQSAGQGLNLPEASAVGVIEIPWSPGVCQQFEARARRMTSLHSVRSTYLVASGSIEEDVCRIIEYKAKILDRVLDGVDVKDDSLTIFDLLKKEMEKRR